MRAKSASERKQEERDRYRAMGLVAVQVWINPKDRERLMKYIARLRAAKESK